MRIKRDREYRRIQDKRRKDKIRRYYYDVVFDHEHRDDEHTAQRSMFSGTSSLESFIGRTASHNHTCSMCGNPRHHYRVISREEHLADIDFAQQLEDLGLPRKRYLFFSSYYS